jgi:hypothetical protein
MHQRAKNTTGNGYLSCGICDEPLSDHKEIFAHDIPELSLRRMRSCGVLRDEGHQPRVSATCAHGAVCERCQAGPVVTGISSLTG